MERLLISAIYEDDTDFVLNYIQENSKNSEEHCPKLNALSYIILTHNNKMLSFFLKEEIIESISTENLIDISQCDLMSSTFAKSTLAKTVTERQILSIVCADAVCIFSELLINNVITLNDKIIEEIVNNSSSKITQFLIHNDYIKYNHSDDYFLTSAIYNNEESLIVFLSSFYKNSSFPNDGFDGVFENANNSTIEVTLEYYSFANYEKNIIFNGLVSNSKHNYAISLIKNSFFSKLSDESFTHALNYGCTDLIYVMLEHFTDLTPHLNYFEALDLGISENNIDFILFLINHPNTNLNCILDRHIVCAIQDAPDAFHFLFPIFCEQHHYSPDYGDMFDAAISANELSIFRKIYFHYFVSSSPILKEDFSITFENSIVSPDIFKFLLTQLLFVNNDIDLSIFAENNISSIPVESLYFLLKYDFPLTEKFYINSCQNFKKGILECINTCAGINTISKTQYLYESIEKNNSQMTFDFFNLNFIDVNELNCMDIIKKIVKNNMFDSFFILQEKTIYSDKCFNELFKISANLSNDDIISFLLEDSRVTEFNDLNLHSNAMIIASSKSNYYSLKNSALLKLLYSDKIDLNVHSSELLMNLLALSNFSHFEYAYNKITVSSDTTSLLFDTVLDNNNRYNNKKDFISFLMNTNNIDYTYNNYSIALKLAKSKQSNYFYTLYFNKELPDNIVTALIEDIIQYENLVSFNHNEKEEKYESLIHTLFSFKNLDLSHNDFCYALKLSQIDNIEKILPIIYSKNNITENFTIGFASNLIKEFKINNALFFINEKCKSEHVIKPIVKEIISISRYSKSDFIEVIKLVFTISAGIDDEKHILCKNFLFKKLLSLDNIDKDFVKIALSCPFLSKYIKLNPSDGYEKYLKIKAKLTIENF